MRTRSSLLFLFPLISVAVISSANAQDGLDCFELDSRSEVELNATIHLCNISSNTEALFKELKFDGGFTGGGLRYLMNTNFNGVSKCCFKASGYYEAEKFVNFTLPPYESSTSEWKITRGCLPKHVCEIAVKGGIMGTCAGGLCICDGKMCNGGNIQKFWISLVLFCAFISMKLY